jgi:hypothetical protein
MGIFVDLIFSWHENQRASSYAGESRTGTNEREPRKKSGPPRDESHLFTPPHKMWCFVPHRKYMLNFHSSQKNSIWDRKDFPWTKLVKTRQDSTAGGVSLILSRISKYITGTDRRTVRAQTNLSLPRPYNAGYRVKYNLSANFITLCRAINFTNPIISVPPSF